MDRNAFDRIVLESFNVCDREHEGLTSVQKNVLQSTQAIFVGMPLTAKNIIKERLTRTTSTTSTEIMPHPVTWGICAAYLIVQFLFQDMVVPGQSEGYVQNTVNTIRAIVHIVDEMSDLTPSKDDGVLWNAMANNGNGAKVNPMYHILKNNLRPGPVFDSITGTIPADTHIIADMYASKGAGTHSALRLCNCMSIALKMLKRYCLGKACPIKAELVPVFREKMVAVLTLAVRLPGPQDWQDMLSQHAAPTINITNSSIVWDGSGQGASSKFSIGLRTQLEQIRTATNMTIVNCTPLYMESLIKTRFTFHLFGMSCSHITDTDRRKILDMANKKFELVGNTFNEHLGSDTTQQIRMNRIMLLSSAINVHYITRTLMSLPWIAQIFSIDNLPKLFKMNNPDTIDAMVASWQNIFFVEYTQEMEDMLKIVLSDMQESIDEEVKSDTNYVKHVIHASAAAVSKRYISRYHYEKRLIQVMLQKIHDTGSDNAFLMCAQYTSTYLLGYEALTDRTQGVLKFKEIETHAIASKNSQSRNSVLSYVRVRATNGQFTMRHRLLPEPGQAHRKFYVEYSTKFDFDDPNKEQLKAQREKLFSENKFDSPESTSDDGVAVAKQQGGVDIDAKYDQMYAFGPFTRVFYPNHTNDDIAKYTHEVMYRLSRKKSVMVMGFGISGAGKTSMLIYLKPDVGVPQAGIVLSWLRKLKDDEGYFEDGIQFCAVEMYANDVNYSPVNGPGRLKEVFRNMAKPIASRGAADNLYDAGFSLPTIDEIRDRHWEELRYDDTTAATWDERSHAISKNNDLILELGAQVVRRIEDPRYRQTKPTPNNDSSSRSHVILTFKVSKNRKELNDCCYLHVVDLAGVENRFDHTQDTAIAQFSQKGTQSCKTTQYGSQLAVKNGTKLEGNKVSCSCFERYLFNDRIESTSGVESYSFIDNEEEEAKKSQGVSMNDPTDWKVGRALREWYLPAGYAANDASSSSASHAPASHAPASHAPASHAPASHQQPRSKPANPLGAWDRKPVSTTRKPLGAPTKGPTPGPNRWRGGGSSLASTSLNVKVQLEPRVRYAGYQLWGSVVMHPYAIFLHALGHNRLFVPYAPIADYKISFLKMRAQTAIRDGDDACIFPRALASLATSVRPSQPNKDNTPNAFKPNKDKLWAEPLQFIGEERAARDGNDILQGYELRIRGGVVNAHTTPALQENVWMKSGSRETDLHEMSRKYTGNVAWYELAKGAKIIPSYVPPFYKLEHSVEMKNVSMDIIQRLKDTKNQLESASQKVTPEQAAHLMLDTLTLFSGKPGVDSDETWKSFVNNSPANTLAESLKMAFGNDDNDGQYNMEEFSKNFKCFITFFARTTLKEQQRLHAYVQMLYEYFDEGLGLNDINTFNNYAAENPQDTHVVNACQVEFAVRAAVPTAMFILNKTKSPEYDETKSWDAADKMVSINKKIELFKPPIGDHAYGFLSESLLKGAHVHTCKASIADSADNYDLGLVDRYARATCMHLPLAKTGPPMQTRTDEPLKPLNSMVLRNTDIPRDELRRIVGFISKAKAIGRKMLIRWFFLFGQVLNEVDTIAKKKENILEEHIKYYMRMRTGEGVFINNSVYALRDSLFHIVDKQNASNIYGNPGFLSECSFFGCHPLLDPECFRKKKDRFDGYDPIMKYIMRYHDDDPNKLKLCIMVAVNLSDNVRDPPAVPYIKYTRLQLAYRIWSFISSGNDLTGQIQKYVDPADIELFEIQMFRDRPYNPIGLDVKPKKELNALLDKALREVKLEIEKALPMAASLKSTYDGIKRLMKADKTTASDDFQLVEMKNIIESIQFHNNASLLGNLAFVDALQKRGADSMCDIAHRQDNSSLYTIDLPQLCGRRTMCGTDSCERLPDISKIGAVSSEVYNVDNIEKSTQDADELSTRLRPGEKREQPRGISSPSAPVSKGDKGVSVKPTSSNEPSPAVLKQPPRQYAIDPVTGDFRRNETR